MNIYEKDGTEGVVNIRRARDELAGVSLIHDAAIRRQNIAEISAAALLDIAASLRVVAADARLGLDDYAAAVVTAAEPEAEEAPVFFDVGDCVYIDGDEMTSGHIRGFGVSEGTQYADVRWDDGTISKVWTKILKRVDAEADPLGIVAETDATLEPIEIVSAERVAEMIGGPAVEADIDSDFDGDTHTAAASALDLLKANEAERKAKKKGSKK